jgi:hypothetical protein
MLDRHYAEVLICLNQRSTSEFGMRGDSVGEASAAALFYPGERDPVIIKIPHLN